MQVTNQSNPTEEQLASFLEAPEDGPFIMVNMLKFREKAEYADGSDADLPGWQAYARYGMAVQDRLKAVGAHQVSGGQVTGLMLGEVEELWDMVALVQYPSLEAMRTMIGSPEYQAITHHREAGLEGQLNIKIKPFGAG